MRWYLIVVLNCVSLIICCCSVAKSCLTLCDSMDWSTSGFSVLHYLPEFAQTQVRWVRDAIQPSDPLLTPSLLALGIFNELALHINIGSSASVFPMNILGWSPLGWTGLISLLSKGLSRVFSSTTVQKHQFFSVQLSLWSYSHVHIWLQEKP